MFPLRNGDNRWHLRRHTTAPDTRSVKAYRTKKDTIPGHRAAMDRKSGVRWDAPAPSEADATPARSASADVAHAEMERGVSIGACTLLSDIVGSDGVHIQWSAWMNGERRLVCRAWYQRPGQAWALGTSYVVADQQFEALQRLMSGDAQQK